MKVKHAALCSSGSGKPYCDCGAEVSALRAELAEWRKDAERYRWLRDKCRDGSLTIARADDWSLHPWSGDDIDKEIDAARKGEETE